MNLDPRLLRLIRGCRLPFVISVILGLSAAVLVILQAAALSKIINRAFLENQSLNQLSSFLILLLAVILLRAIVTWGGEVSSKAIAVRVKTKLRTSLVERLYKLGPMYVRGESTGELNNTLVEGVESLDAYYSQYLPQLVLALLVPVVFLTIIFPIDPLTGVILLLTAPLIPFFMILIGNMAQRQTSRQWNALSRMGAYFLDILQGLTTLKSLGRSRSQVSVIEQVSEHYRKTTMSVLRITFLSALALELVATLSTAIVAVEIGLRLMAGKMMYEQALFLLLLAPEFYLPLRLLGTRFHAGMAGVAAARRIFDVLETPIREDGNPKTEMDNELSEYSYTSKVVSSFDKVIFDNVYYTYGKDREALNGVRFTIKQGEKVALVGPSGSGKSTIAYLLLRFIEPSRGEIFIGERPSSSIEGDAWRLKIAWVSQYPHIFYGSVADNIRLSKPNASFDEIVQAARRARAHDFIDRLTDGYETMIGKRGARLSSGQIQRIALARAFLKDAPILIMDEPSANLDPVTEEELMGAIDELLIGRTALIIAHRLNTTINADRILVLENGRIVERGIHSKLMRENGLYRRMVSASEEITVVQEAVSTGSNQSVATRKPNNEREALLSLVPPPHPNLPYIGHASTKRSRFVIFKRLLSLVSPYKGRVAISVLSSSATILSGIGLLATSAFLISKAALRPSIAELQVAIVGVRFFGISRGVFRYLERLTSHQVTFRVLANLKVQFYRALEPLAPARLMQYRSGDLYARIQDDTEELQNFYVRVLAPPFTAVLIAVVMGLFMASFNPSLALILITFLSIVAIGIPIIVHVLSRKPGRRAVELRGRLNVALIENIQGMDDLLAFGQVKKMLADVESLSKKWGANQMQIARVDGIQNSLILLFTHICVWAVLILAIPMVSAGNIDGVYLAVIVLAALASFEAVTPLPQAARYLESNLVAGERLFDIVDAQPEVKEPSHPIPVPESCSLEVKNLSFCYPQSDTDEHEAEVPESVNNQKEVLHKVSLKLLPGRKIAIVGPSGAGKSTLVNLLLRFFEYNKGSILLGDSELHAYDSYQLRDRISLVAQDSYLFNASVRENMLIARPDASQEEIENAARRAQIHEFILGLPKEYETQIGDRGLTLSGGERQRLIVARALLRDTPLLILDEVTANLDPITERELLNTIYTIARECSVLMVTHRLVGLDNVDEILVMREGKIVEQGTHQALMDSGGYYHFMWELQHQKLIESF
jgi:ATP-binding cassette subfamily C protein CydCD